GDDVHPIVTGSCAPLPMPPSVPPVTVLTGEAGGVSGARARADRPRIRAERSRADRPRAGTRRSRAEAPLAPAEVPQGAQQVDAAEPGPVGLAEPVLGVHGLPQQEAGEPLFAGGADDEVRVRLPPGVEVLGHGLDADPRGDALAVQTLGGQVPHQLLHGVDDLPPRAVADGRIDPPPGLRGDLHLLSGGAGPHRLRQGLGVAGQPYAVAGLDDPADRVADDRVEGGELLGRAAQVVGGQHPHGDQGDVEVVAPGEELEDLRCARTMAVLGALPRLLRPATVAVDDDAQVLRELEVLELAEEPPFVDAVQKAVIVHRAVLPSCWPWRTRPLRLPARRAPPDAGRRDR